MKRSSLILALALVCFLAFPSPHLLAAPGDYTVLRMFADDGNGRGPSSQQVLVDGSKIYGMAAYGGANGWGVVYSMNLDGTGYTVLHSFSNGTGDGYVPTGALALSGSTLYGMTGSGGANNRGAIFSMNTDGSGYTVLRSLSVADGWGPFGSLTLSGTKLYGMAQNGGANNLGAVFSMDTNGSNFTVLHSFNDADGRGPMGTLTLDGSTLYGVTREGGASHAGVVFSMGTNGSGYAVLHQFTGGADGSAPYGGPVISGSTLYGVACGGGSGAGVVFSMAANDGSGFTVLHSFAGGATDGNAPDGSLTLSGSSLYGMTIFGGASNVGVLFSMGTDGSGFTVLHSFTGADGGYPCYESPTISGSVLYGQTTNGGTGNVGVTFKYELAPASPPVTWDFEDGTTGDWGIASHSQLTVMQNVVDPDQNGDVIELKANTMDTWFCMGGPGGADLGETNTVAQWSLKSEGFFYFYVEVDTTLGPRTLYYTPVGTDKLLEGTYIHHSLAYAAVYNQWCTFTRDLDADLKDAEPANSVLAVNRFCVRGTNMRVDDLGLLAAIPVAFDSDNDGLTDLEERDTYGTGLYDADSDDDGLNDGPEATIWGVAWNANPDGDGEANLLDQDSDNDGFDDGTEAAAGSDPADAGSVPPVSYDWNDGGTSGWTVASGLGLVRNVARDAGRAIELRGSTSTTFSLKNADGTLWHDNVHGTLAWDMKASAMYYLMVDLQTANGHRTLLYTPSDADLGQSGEYLRFGLGVVSKNGTWQSFNRNLATDVSTAEPGNTILEVNQILYKGPGFFDNVQLQ